MNGKLKKQNVLTKANVVPDLDRNLWIPAGGNDQQPFEVRDNLELSDWQRVGQ